MSFSLICSVLLISLSCCSSYRTFLKRIIPISPERVNTFHSISAVDGGNNVHGDIDEDDQLFVQNVEKMKAQRQSEKNNRINENNGILENFVPTFVAIWAIGYTALAAFETSGNGGFGDKGGNCLT